MGQESRLLVGREGVRQLVSKGRRYTGQAAALRVVISLTDIMRTQWLRALQAQSQAPEQALEQVPERG